MANHLFLLTVFTMPQCICCKKYSQLDASPKKHLKMLSWTILSETRLISWTHYRTFSQLYYWVWTSCANWHLLQQLYVGAKLKYFVQLQGDGNPLLSVFLAKGFYRSEVNFYSNYLLTSWGEWEQPSCFSSWKTNWR